MLHGSRAYSDRPVSDPFRALQKAMQMLKKAIRQIFHTMMSVLALTASATSADAEYLTDQPLLAGPSPTGHLLVNWWSREARAWQTVDVSAKTDQPVAGPVTIWQVWDGNYTFEHIAGPSPSGDLLVYWWWPGADWQVVNVSDKTGHKIAGPVTSWQTPDGPYTVEHVAGPSPTGDLLVYWWSPRADWQVVNVSAIPGGQKVAGAVTSWQTMDGPYNVEHLAGPSLTDVYRPAGARNPPGDLLEYWWSPQADWQVVNVSAIPGGQQMAGPVTSWQTTEGPYRGEHLAGPSALDDLLEYWRRSQKADWQVVNISAITNQKVVDLLGSWVAGSMELIAATGPDEKIYVFWRTPGTDWDVVSAADAANGALPIGETEP
jgi:hypothetical protein